LPRVPIVFVVCKRVTLFLLLFSLILLQELDPVPRDKHGGMPESFASLSYPSRTQLILWCRQFLVKFPYLEVATAPFIAKIQYNIGLPEVFPLRHSPFGRRHLSRVEWASHGGPSALFHVKIPFLILTGIHCKPLHHSTIPTPPRISC